MSNWLKNKWRKVFNNWEIQRSSEFNFEAYILGLGFKFISEKNDFKLYVNNYGGIKINLIVNFKKEEVLIYHKSVALSRINFIPKGSLFVDMLISQTLNNVEKNYVVEQ